MAPVQDGEGTASVEDRVEKEERRGGEEGNNRY